MLLWKKYIQNWLSIINFYCVSPILCFHWKNFKFCLLIFLSKINWTNDFQAEYFYSFYTNIRICPPEWEHIWTACPKVFDTRNWTFILGLTYAIKWHVELICWYGNRPPATKHLGNSEKEISYLNLNKKKKFFLHITRSR